MASPRGGDDDYSNNKGYEEAGEEEQERLVQAPPSTARTFFIPIKSASPDMRQDWLERVYLYFSLCGAAHMVVGVCAIALPLIFSSAITVQQLVYWTLIVAGVLSLLHFLLVFGAPATTSFLLLGILHLGVGLWLLIQPSIRTLSIFLWILMAWFIVHGLFKLLMACQLRNVTAWPALLISGVISILLAVANLVFTSSFGVTFLSILFGADLAVTGLAFFLISIMAYLAARAPASQEPLLQEASYHAVSPRNV